MLIPNAGHTQFSQIHEQISLFSQANLGWPPMSSFGEIGPGGKGRGREESCYGYKGSFRQPRGGSRKPLVEEIGREEKRLNITFD